jgi:geranylgeranyl diphosphate synthase, type II
VNGASGEMAEASAAAVMAAGALREGAPLTARAAYSRIEEARRFAESWIERVMPPVHASPARLHHAMRDAVIPGGKRVRPMLVALVAEACTGASPQRELVGRFAAAVELVHCASLVHDDLPAFDDAPARRGRPTCHAAWGEPAAILVGDALLALAFEVLGGGREDVRAALRLVGLLAECTGSRHGIIGGQALELEPAAPVREYHVRKTASLFRAAAAGAAIAVGEPGEVLRWARFGSLVGEVLQLRDDLDDTGGDAPSLGKPAGRDLALGRPNAVLASSRAQAAAVLRERVREADRVLPDHAAGDALRLVLAAAAGDHLRVHG